MARVNKRKAFWSEPLMPHVLSGFELAVGPKAYSRQDVVYGPDTDAR